MSVMRKIILSAIVVILALAVWSSWGGFANSVGSVIVGLGATLAITVIFDGKSGEKVKE